MSIRPAHQHIFAVSNSLLRTHRDNRLRVLDIGCGDAHLMRHLKTSLSDEYRSTIVEVHGFDITEQGYNDSDQLSCAHRLLRDAHPQEDWKDRLKTWSAEADWEYPDGFFDLAVSKKSLPPTSSTSPPQTSRNTIGETRESTTRSHSANQGPGYSCGVPPRSDSRSRASGAGSTPSTRTPPEISFRE